MFTQVIVQSNVHVGMRYAFAITHVHKDHVYPLIGPCVYPAAGLSA